MTPVYSSQSIPDPMGHLFSHTQANPAAGADFTFVVPENERWRIISASWVFVADANGANRTITFEILNDEGTPVRIYTNDHPTAIVATQTDRFVLAENLERQHVGGIIHIPLPNHLLIKQGYTLRTATANIQVGDQFSAIRFYVERWTEE